MSQKIHVSSDYSKFELLPFNRDIRRLKALKTSMAKYGWLDPYPMHVEPQKNHKLLIKAGHRRFTVARELGIPVKYITVDAPISVFELERGSTPWNPQDFLTAYVREGKRPAYVMVQKYQKRTGIPLNCCISMLAGEAAGSNNRTEAFKLGTYELAANPFHAIAVENIVDFLKNRCQFSYAPTTSFVIALSRICWVPEFNTQHFMEKAKKHKYLLEKKRYRDEYVKMIETVYNHHSQSKIPLEFYATEVARKRSVALIEKKQSNKRRPPHHEKI